MDTMTAATGRRLTRDDLDRMPDDGNRYELIEGEIVVSPSPRMRHQLVLANLYLIMHDAAPDDLRVLFAPFDVVLDQHSVVEPDLLVFEKAAGNDRALETPPLLAVEVLSPSTRSRDLVRKKNLYERYGVPSYWVIDPGRPDADRSLHVRAADVTLTAWELRDGRYAEAATVTADEPWTATRPFPVTITTSLLAR